MSSLIILLIVLLLKKPNIGHVKAISATSLQNSDQYVEDFPNEKCFLLHNITFNFLGHPIFSTFLLGKFYHRLR